MPENSNSSAVNLDATPCPGFLLADKRTESTFDEIPVIDISGAYDGNTSARRELADQIRDACINVGFFYVKGHRIPEKTVERTIDAAKQFFALPEATKTELDIHKSANFKGYTALLGENTDVTGNGDLHEGFDMGYEPKDTASQAPNASNSVMSGDNVWPEGLPGFRDAVLEYYHSALDLGRTLFPLFALALNLPEHWFADKTTQSAAIMRLLHYPPQSPTKVDEGQIGIGAHTEFVGFTWGSSDGRADIPPLKLRGKDVCFTILWQDKAGGLQVKNTSDKWIDAVPIPGTVVVNLGDQFARWTNDVFKSTPHRVINRSGRERYSIPLFFGTDYDVLLEPISTCIYPDCEPKYEVVSAGDYVKSRLEATYAHSATK